MSVKILYSSLLSALGNTTKTRLSNLKNAKIDTTMQSSDNLQESYPYYMLDDASREPTHTMVLTYLYRVIDDILAQAKLTQEEIASCGLFLGTSSIDLSIAYPLERVLDESYANTLKSQRVGAGYYLEAISKKYGFNAFSLTYNTACTSSANALLDATTLIKQGELKRAIVLGLELFNPTTLEGFVSMQLLSQSSLKPFDAHRDGIILGEAIAAVMLGDEALKEGDCAILGGSSVCETHSVSGSNPNGEHMSELLELALEDAKVTQKDITLIKAHGTASELNDLAELNALKLTFEPIPPFVSFKSYIGHSLGACGVAELIVLYEMLQEGSVFPNIHFKTPIEPNSPRPIEQNLTLSQGIFMLNYFGFGGNNTSIIMQRL